MFFETLMATSTPSNWGPFDDRWYTAAPGAMSAAGMHVDENAARKLSAWYRGRDLLATTLAMIPWNVYERLPDDAGSEVARGQPLYDILHTKPNAWMDSYAYRRMKMFHLIDHGNGYDFIKAGPRGFVDELWPIKPTLVTPQQLESKRVIYHIRDEKTGQTQTYTQDEIFHLRGASDDGVVGKGVLQFARDNIGTAMAVESYAAKIFGRGTLNGGVIENPGLLNPEAGKRMAETFITAPGEWHVPKVLEQGSKWIQNAMSPQDFEMILSRKYSVTDIARWLGLPPHMIGDLERATFSNIEHQGQEFVTYSLGPWLSLFEFSANDQLVLNTKRFYTEFVREALVRGDIAARSTADVAYVNAGIETVDEVRARNNKNKMGGKAAELRDPQNITGKGTAGGPDDNRRPGKVGAPDDKAQAIVVSAAARVLQLEVTAVQRLAVKHGKDQDAFAAAIADFYAAHVARVVDILHFDDPAASGYCASQSSQVLGGWLQAIELFKTEDYARGLAAWALETAA